MKRTVGCRTNLKRKKPEYQASSAELCSTKSKAQREKDKKELRWAAEQDECLIKVTQANWGNWRTIGKIVTKRFHELPRSGTDCKSRYERLTRAQCNDVCTPQFEFFLLFFCHSLEQNWLSISDVLSRSPTELQHLFCQYLTRIAYLLNKNELPCFEKINPTEIMKILIGIHYIIKSLKFPTDSFPELLEALNEKNITIQECFGELERISENSFLFSIKWNLEKLEEYLEEATEAFLNSVLSILPAEDMQDVMHKRLPPLGLPPDMLLPPPPLMMRYSREGLQTLNSWLTLLGVSFAFI